MRDNCRYRGILAGIIASVFFLGMFFILHWHFVICAILAFGLWGAVYLLLKPTQKIGQVSIENMINGDELAIKMKEAKEDFANIERAVSQIKDQELNQEAVTLHRIAGNILSYLEKHPDKIPMARRFIDYYQDTASSLLLRYVELQNTQLDTQEARQLKNSTKEAIGTLNGAFEKQFEKLMNNELMDMDAEISLLEKTSKMEGMS